MDYELRVIVEKVAVSSQEVVKRDTIKSYDIQRPESIVDLGLRHAEQISLLEKIQNALLAEQSVLIDSGVAVCPKCGQKLRKNGTQVSDFHAVFSDHKLRLQRHCCSNAECHWQGASTIHSVFGTNIHPDLAKLQCEQGALYSYREAERNLGKLNGQPRSVNNHAQVKRITDKVGRLLAEQNGSPPAAQECASPARDLIVQVDGGHIPIQEKDQRSFEALAAVVYRPEAIQTVDNHHREIVEKTCVMSAQDDNLHSIKTFLLHGALKQGLGSATHVTALADGAKNCWAVLLAIQPYCGTLECILDWFHIGKKFQTVQNALGEALEASLERAKWKLWHGKAEEALAKLALLRNNITDEAQKSKMTGLYNYIDHNQAYIVDYDERATTHQTYTSQVAESHIDSLINARHKRTGKMQWSREGADNVLQIRATMASKEWVSKWQSTVLSALGAAA
jgi:hypothetical protein